MALHTGSAVPHPQGTQAGADTDTDYYTDTHRQAGRQSTPILNLLHWPRPVTQPYLCVVPERERGRER